MIVPFVACLCLLSIPSQLSKPLPVQQQQQKPFCVNQSLCSTSPGRRLIQNLAEDIKTNETKIYQVKEGKGLCHQMAQKAYPVSFGRKRVKLSCTGIPFPTHERSMLSLLLDSHVKWKRTHGFSKASHLPDVISMWIFPFKVQSFYLKILWGTVQSSCKMPIFKGES